MIRIIIIIIGCYIITYYNITYIIFLLNNKIKINVFKVPSEMNKALFIYLLSGRV